MNLLDFQLHKGLSDRNRIEDEEEWEIKVMSRSRWSVSTLRIL